MGVGVGGGGVGVGSKIKGEKYRAKNARSKMFTVPFWSTSPPVLKFEITMIRSAPFTTPFPPRSAVSSGDATLTVTVA